MDIEFSFWIRLVNCMLGGIVAGLCFLKLENSHPDKARNYRIAGLGVLCFAISWGSFSQRFDKFSWRLLVVTLGLCLSYYGMRRMAIGEKPQYRN